MVAKTGRAIIMDKNNDIIFVKRTKYNEDMSINKVYYTFPGGHLEGEETFEEATIREVYEELGVEVFIDKEFIHLFNEELNRDEIFYTAHILSGKLGTGNGPEFQNVDYTKYGKYEIVKINKKNLNEYNVLPIEVKNKILENYKKVC